MCRISKIICSKFTIYDNIERALSYKQWYQQFLRRKNEKGQIG